MSKGSDLFYEPFKGDGGLSTKERQRVSGEQMNAMTHSAMFVYKMLSPCSTTINGSFPLLSDTTTMLWHFVLLLLELCGKLEG